MGGGIVEKGCVNKGWGKLYIVATPIGNLGEITYRAVEVLKSVDIVACEDTRKSAVLLSRYDIKKPMLSYRQHNERASAKGLVEQLVAGKSIALITDSGMPLISDPGLTLVRALREAGIEYTVISGATAFVNALVLSGYDTANFTFVGFLKGKQKERRELLESLKALPHPLIFYVAPHDVKKDLQFLYETLGDRDVCVVREISKVYEEVLHTTLSAGYSKEPKGEFVIVVAGAKKENALNSQSVAEHLAYYTKSGMDKKEATKQVAKDRGVAKSEIYKLLINV